jgi:2-dehydropantoate 2-reductase
MWGGYLALHSHDVTLIDFWPEHIEAIRKNGLELSGMTQEERQVSHPKTMRLHEVASLAKQAPVDIASISMKSCDTEWMTQLIKRYLAPGGYVVSLQNCINEERIADIVGWGRTLGCIGSRISVELFEPGKILRQAPKGAASHTVFRAGEIHGRATECAKRVAELLGVVDGSQVSACRSSVQSGWHLLRVAGLPGERATSLGAVGTAEKCQEVALRR